jgi:hypothetical protein
METESNGSAMPKSQAPFPDPTTRLVGFVPFNRVDSMLKQLPLNQFYLNPPTSG